jgi:tetratricopeptide (TPR) repeat protein
MPTAPISAALSFRWLVLGLATLALTIAVYWPGLHGDFLFDDNPHIVKNDLVHIRSLAPNDLWQAWNSSPFSFPGSRPLAMLTFGVNHAVSGLDPFAFKATNLALHLLTGALLYLVCVRLGSLFLTLRGGTFDEGRVRLWAWLAATLWLVHPLNLSPVLLSVQRMTILSTACVLLGLLAYVLGRRRLVEGNRAGFAWIAASPLFAGVGLLAKENAILLPALLLVTEWTLFRFAGTDDRARLLLKTFFWLTVALPLIVLVWYLVQHPGYLDYARRPFSLEERLLTQARVLWFYVRLVFAPDIGALGLFHDDFSISRGLLAPWATLPALLGLGLAAIAAIALRARLPLFSFAVLFFLVGHAMESSIIPLELVYEHRNYLPMLGAVFAVAYLPTVAAAGSTVSRGAIWLLVGSIILALSATTALRAHDWSGFGRLVLAEVEHHPESARANFQYAQLLMAQLEQPEHATDAAAEARRVFDRVARLDPNQVDGLFGLVVLDLHLGRQPSPELVASLAERLRRIPFNPLNVNIKQFSFLVQWHEAVRGGVGLSPAQMISLFEAALANPTVNGASRIALYHALRAYYQRVLRDNVRALEYATLAVQTSPSDWVLRDRRIRLLAVMGLWDEADRALADAERIDSLGLYRADAEELRRTIAAARRGEPVPVMPEQRNSRSDAHRE